VRDLLVGGEGADGRAADDGRGPGRLHRRGVQRREVVVGAGEDDHRVVGRRHAAAERGEDRREAGLTGVLGAVAEAAQGRAGERQDGGATGWCTDRSAACPC
jgi:hypothetical protein